MYPQTEFDVPGEHLFYYSLFFIRALSPHAKSSLNDTISDSASFFHYPLIYRTKSVVFHQPVWQIEGRTLEYLACQYQLISDIANRNVTQVIFISA